MIPPHGHVRECVGVRQDAGAVGGQGAGGGVAEAKWLWEQQAHQAALESKRMQTDIPLKRLTALRAADLLTGHSVCERPPALAAGVPTTVLSPVTLSKASAIRGGCIGSVACLRPRPMDWLCIVNHTHQCVLRCPKSGTIVVRLYCCSSY
jgi:hypothetical protein